MTNEKSALRRAAAMIKMPSTSTSHSGSTDNSKKMIDDVPLNETVSKKTATSTTKSTSGKSSGSSKPKSSAKVAPLQSTTTVSGNKDLKLKVSHNDAGRVIISLSNPERVLVQVQVDESVLKKKSLKKSKKTTTGTDEKERPKKKSTVTKAKSKSSSTKAVEKKSKSGSSSGRKHEKPRDLPEEETSKRGKRSSSKLKIVQIDEQNKSATNFHNSNICLAGDYPSPMDDVASHHSSYSDDDSTRSPKDLNRTAAAVPKTPVATKMTIMEVNTPSTEPSLGGNDNVVMTDAISVMTPASNLDRRKQALMQFKRQSSGFSIASTSGPMIGPEDDSVERTKLQDYHAHEAKMEETASHDGTADSGGGVFSSPFQQRRLQQRQKRLERQRSENESAFRSTRSIRSGGGGGGASTLDPPSQSSATSSTGGGGVGQFGMVVEPHKRAGTSTPTQQQPTQRRSSINSDGNKARHTRTVALPPSDEEDSEVATSNRIRNTLAEVRKVELTNRGDIRSGRSSFQGQYPRRRSEAEDEQQHEDSNNNKSSAKKWVTKMCDKVCNKRLRKDHHKL